MTTLATKVMSLFSILGFTSSKRWAAARSSALRASLARASLCSSSARLALMISESCRYSSKASIPLHCKICSARGSLSLWKLAKSESAVDVELLVSSYMAETEPMLSMVSMVQKIAV